MKGLLLDDERGPELCFHKTGHQIYLQTNWTIVKNYNEFVKYIETNGLPDVISFDHDLANEHYKNGADYNWRYFNYEIVKEKTGYHAALWLLTYIVSNDCKIPLLYVHSANPYGSKMINKVLNKLKHNEKVLNKLY